MGAVRSATSALRGTSAGKGTTSMRGGIGLSYQPPFLEAYNQMSATPPFSQQVDLRRARYPRMTFADPYGYGGRAESFPGGLRTEDPRVGRGNHQTRRCRDVCQ